MIKLALSSIVIILASYLSIVSAQSFLGFGGDKSDNNSTVQPASNPSANTAAPAVHVLSPKDFKSTVTKLNQQTQTNLNSQLNQQISKRPVTPAQQSTNTPIAATPSAPITGTQSTALPNMPPPQNLPTSSAQPSPSTQPQYAPSSQQNTVIAPSTPSQQQQQQPIYSGFQGPQDNQKGSTSKPADQSGGGWNIKY